MASEGVTPTWRVLGGEQTEAIHGSDCFSGLRNEEFPVVVQQTVERWGRDVRRGVEGGGGRRGR